MLKNSSQSYGWISIILHWLSAVAVFGLFGVGFWMVDLSYYSEWYRTAPHYHKSVGILLALVILIRLLWKALQAKPVPLGNKTENTLAKLAHTALYVLLLAIMLSGYLISTADGRGIEVFNWFEVPSLGEFVENQEDIAGLVHEWLAYTIIALAVLHAAAAIKHHFIDKDVTLKRMLRPINHNEEKL